MPGLSVFRPADMVEAAECWKAAIRGKGPSMLVLSRQKVPAVRGQDGSVGGGDWAAKGAYELSAASGDAQVSLFATGTEVSIAIAAQKTLEAEGITTRVVSCPSWDHFAAQTETYRQTVMGSAKLNIAIEAGCGLGWERFIGSEGVFIGMTGFGASAPADRLFKEFGITMQAIVSMVKSKLS